MPNAHFAPYGARSGMVTQVLQNNFYLYFDNSMLNKHFFKILTGFITLIVIGLILLFGLNYYDERYNTDINATVDKGQ